MPLTKEQLRELRKKHGLGEFSVKAKRNKLRSPRLTKRQARSISRRSTKQRLAGTRLAKSHTFERKASVRNFRSPRETRTQLSADEKNRFRVIDARFNTQPAIPPS